MSTCPLVFPVPVPRMLWTILLLAASLSTENTIWDSPNCSNNNVSEPRGSRIVMSCNMSNTFSSITISLRAHGERKIIFEEKPPGDFRSPEGYQLWVQESMAQMVIEEAQDTHEGLYTWHLKGRQRNNKNFTLKVSDVYHALPQARSTPKAWVALVVTFLVLLVAGLSLLCWHRRRRFQKLQQI
ncbi:secreted and transmembrane protein 1 [Carlito syrichta]|uniref:Secreted and transmembrane protein 1 n=1 Tax=Carlito syrichta TaxID=1868482 RepID=A0A1U7SR38_CARSF|nr:secreted and transmembrane protein 1 [Carlito syrichta]